MHDSRRGSGRALATPLQPDTSVPSMLRARYGAYASSLPMFRVNAGTKDVANDEQQDELRAEDPLELVRRCLRICRHQVI